MTRRNCHSVGRYHSRIDVAKHKIYDYVEVVVDICSRKSIFGSVQSMTVPPRHATCKGYESPGELLLL